MIRFQLHDPLMSNAAIATALSAACGAIRDRRFYQFFRANEDVAYRPTDAMDVLCISETHPEVIDRVCTIATELLVESRNDQAVA